MRMSCNGCRVLRKGCSETCIIRPCLQWIKNEESQANATVFLAKFYGRAGLMNLISAGPEHLRPAIFRSLLYEACGRMANPIFGSVGLLCSGNWQVCQAAVESILKGCPIHPILVDSTGMQMPTERSNTNPSAARSTLMETITNELHKVKTKGRFKRRKSTAKDLSLNNSDAEDLAASQVFNLRWRRCYPGEAAAMEGTRNNLVSSDSSCESLEHFDDPINCKQAEIEGNVSNGMSLVTANDKCCNDQNDQKTAMESVTELSYPQEAADLEDMQPIKHEYESIASDDTEVKLELTLSSQGTATHSAEKYHPNIHWNSCLEHSDEPTITYLGLGLTQE